MTIGGVHRQIDALKKSVDLLLAARNGSAFTDKQTEQINEISEGHAKTHSKAEADRTFNRLILWAAGTAFVGGGAVVAAVLFSYLKLKG